MASVFPSLPSEVTKPEQEEAEEQRKKSEQPTLLSQHSKPVVVQATNLLDDLAMAVLKGVESHGV